MKEENFYVKIEKEWFEGNECLLRQYGSDKLLIYTLLKRNLTFRDSCIFSINDLLKTLKINSKNSKMINKIKEIIKQMNEKLFIAYKDHTFEEKLDISKMNNSETYCAKLFNNSVSNNDSCIKIYDSDIDTIIEIAKIKNMSRNDIVAYFMFYTYLIQTNNKTIIEINTYILQNNKMALDISNLKRINFLLTNNKIVLIGEKINKYYNLESYILTTVLNEVEFKNILSKNPNRRTNIQHEKEFEDILYNNIELFEKGMKVIGRQYAIKDGFIDILSRDKNNILCIIELKTKKDDNRIVFQCVYYPTQFKEPTRMITISPNYSCKIKTSLKSLAYVEMYQFDINKFNKNKEIVINRVT